MIGSYPRLVPVPSHFFKVIRGVRYVSLHKSTNNPDSSLQQVVIGSFLVPNQNISSKASSSHVLTLLCHNRLII